MSGCYIGNLKIVAVAGVWERVLFLEHFCITSPNAICIHYFGIKTFKDKKCVFILIYSHIHSLIYSLSNIY